jgi:hypothetical protein
MMEDTNVFIRNEGEASPHVSGVKTCCFGTDSLALRFLFVAVRGQLNASKVHLIWKLQSQARSLE